MKRKVEGTKRKKIDQHTGALLHKSSLISPLFPSVCSLWSSIRVVSPFAQASPHPFISTPDFSFEYRPIILCTSANPSAQAILFISTPSSVHPIQPLVRQSVCSFHCPVRVSVCVLVSVSVCLSSSSSSLFLISSLSLLPLPLLQQDLKCRKRMMIATQQQRQKEIR